MVLICSDQWLAIRLSHEREFKLKMNCLNILSNNPQYYPTTEVNFNGFPLKQKSVDNDLFNMLTFRERLPNLTLY